MNHASDLLEALPGQAYAVICDLSKPLPPYVHSTEQDERLNHEYVHEFCGPNDIPGAWCPNCDKPLTKFLDLDTADPRLEMSKVSRFRLPLLYCWRCNVILDATEEYGNGNNLKRVPWRLAQGYSRMGHLFELDQNRESSGAPFMYRVDANGAVSVIQYAVGFFSDNQAWRSGYPNSFPLLNANLVRITPEYVDDIMIYNCSDDPEVERRIKEVELEVPIHQVGGEPAFAQRHANWSMTCPECMKLMPFFAAIADDSGTAHGFSWDIRNEVIYHFCRACKIVGCYCQLD